jgi:hypothetical protein
VGAVAFLLVAVVLSAVGSAILLLRQRKPTGVSNSVDSFRREMDALAPPDQRQRR